MMGYDVISERLGQGKGDRLGAVGEFDLVEGPILTEAHSDDLRHADLLDQHKGGWHLACDHHLVGLVVAALDDAKCHGAASYWDVNGDGMHQVASCQVDGQVVRAATGGDDVQVPVIQLVGMDAEDYPGCLSNRKELDNLKVPIGLLSVDPDLLRARAGHGDV